MEEVCVQRNKRRKDGNTDSGLNRGGGAGEVAGKMENLGK